MVFTDISKLKRFNTTRWNKYVSKRINDTPKERNKQTKIQMRIKKDKYTHKKRKKNIFATIKYIVLYVIK